MKAVVVILFVFSEPLILFLPITVKTRHLLPPIRLPPLILHPRLPLLHLLVTKLRILTIILLVI